MNIKIDKGIPIPPISCGGLQKTMLKLQIGDSFLWPKEKAHSIGATARFCRIKIRRRKIDERMVRVWRVE